MAYNSPNASYDPANGGARTDDGDDDERGSGGDFDPYYGTPYERPNPAAGPGPETPKEDKKPKKPKKESESTPSTPSPAAKPLTPEEQAQKKASDFANSAEGKALNATNIAATGAQSRAIGGAQAAGLSPAAAANAGAQADVNTFSNVFPQMELGMTQQELEKYLAQQQIDQQNSLNSYNMFGNILSGLGLGAGLLFSDKNAKTSIKDGFDMLDHVVKEVKGKSYSYKSSPNKEEYGVMAQDLEKTPLKSTVVDTPQGKMVDTRRLTTANTGMIAELSDKLDKALEYIGRVR